MKPFTNTNTLPLSIAQVDSTVYEEPDTRAATDSFEVRGRLLAAVTTRVGEVETAEWTLDQATAACELQITAALSADVPAGRVAATAGLSASALAEFIPGREPAPAEG